MDTVYQTDSKEAAHLAAAMEIVPRSVHLLACAAKRTSRHSDQPFLDKLAQCHEAMKDGAVAFLDCLVP